MLMLANISYLQLYIAIIFTVWFFSEASLDNQANDSIQPGTSAPVFHLLCRYIRSTAVKVALADRQICITMNKPSKISVIELFLIECGRTRKAVLWRRTNDEDVTASASILRKPSGWLLSFVSCISFPVHARLYNQDMKLRSTPPHLTAAFCASSWAFGRWWAKVPQP